MSHLQRGLWVLSVCLRVAGSLFREGSGGVIELHSQISCAPIEETIETLIDNYNHSIYLFFTHFLSREKKNIRENTTQIQDHGQEIKFNVLI